MSLDQADREQARKIAGELSKIARAGAVLPGSLTERFTHCGRPGCVCQADPPRPHGPYRQWTRKVAGKTVTVRLTDAQLEHYRPWFENMRRLRELVGELEALSLKAAARAEGWGHEAEVARDGSDRRVR